MDEVRQDRIDKYVLGQLLIEEREKFEQELSKDKELYEQYNYTRMLKDTITNHAKLEELMREWDKTLDGHSEGYNINRPNRKIWYWISAVAAIFIFTILIITPNKQNSNIEYISNLNIYARNSGNELYQIDSLLIRKEFSKALTLIERNEKKVSNISFSKNLDNDITYEDQKEEIEYEYQEITRYKDDLVWMKIYALIGLKRKKAALALLKTLKMKEGFYKERADSLYKLLN